MCKYSALIHCLVPKPNAEHRLFKLEIYLQLISSNIASRITLLLFNQVANLMWTGLLHATPVVIDTTLTADFLDKFTRFTTSGSFMSWSPWFWLSGHIKMLLTGYIFVPVERWQQFQWDRYVKSELVRGSGSGNGKNDVMEHTNMTNKIGVKGILIIVTTFFTSCIYIHTKNAHYFSTGLTALPRLTNEQIIRSGVFEP